MTVVGEYTCEFKHASSMIGHPVTVADCMVPDSSRTVSYFAASWQTCPLSSCPAVNFWSARTFSVAVLEIASYDSGLV